MRPPRQDLPRELETLLAGVLEATGLSLRARKEVEAELRDHLEDGLDRGRSVEELVTAFGDPAEVGHRIGRARQARHGSSEGPSTGRVGMWTETLWTELYRSIRTLARAPGYVAVVVATLALGVGANTAIFSVLHSVILQDLPYPEPQRLVRVYSATPDDPSNFNYLRAPTVAAYQGWTEIFQDFGALYTYRERGADLTDGDQPVRITVVPVTHGYFETLGVPPMLGRPFTESESFPPLSDDGLLRESSVPVTLLSNRLWEEQFAADPGAVGRTLRLDGVSHEVVGVMPAGFQPPFGPEADAWVPQDLTRNMDSWGNYYLSGVARLADGVSLEMAQERATALYGALAETNPQAGEWGPQLRPLQADLVGDTRSVMIWVLAGAAGLVLLTACLNVANLVLARGMRRRRDVAVQAALGSGRRRIVAGIVAEHTILAALGGALGLALGWLGVRGLMILAPDALPSTATPEFGGAVFLFTLGVTMTALFFFGVLPAWRLAGTPPSGVLRAGDRAATRSRSGARARDALVVAQVAAALVLVAGGALLARSFGAIRDVPLTVDPQGVLTFEVHLPEARYSEGAQRRAFHRRLQERLGALPGVQAAGATSWLPMNGRYHIWGVYYDPENPGVMGDDSDRWFSSDMRIFAGDYFQVVGLEVLQGRPPSQVDLESEPMAWISRTSAQELFQGADPVGRQIGAAGSVRRVMGVVEDVPVNARGRVTRHTYIPHAQHADDRNWALIQTVRTRGEPAELQQEIRAVLAELDPDLVLYQPRTLQTIVGAARAQDRFATLLMGVFALLALTLSLVGTYGVLAESVASRRRELGIRLALGAQPGRLRRMIVWYAARLTLPGVALGLVVAVAGGRALESLLFQVEVRDPTTYLVTAGALVAVGLLSAWAPARRATRVDTVEVLRTE